MKRDNNMLVKVCGMREKYNIEALTQLPVDFIGLIFYPKSSRYIFADPSSVTPLRVDPDYVSPDHELVDVDFLRDPIKSRSKIPRTIKKVGVFVDEELDQVLNYVHSFQLDYVQLHGKENVFYCKELKAAGVNLFKAFAIHPNFSFTQTEAFEYYCDYFLFDTKGKQPGGNGITFDWSMLDKYYGETPFFLSGGLAPGMEKEILALEHQRFIGLDLNSGFENYPGFKNVEVISDFLNKLNSAMQSPPRDW